MQPYERINTFKKQRGWTLKQLAEKSGIPYGTLTRLTSGKGKVTETQRNKLAKAFGVRPEQLTATGDEENFGIVRVAAATPALRVANCRYNADSIVKLLKKLDDDGVSFAVLPELCLTGYSCDDLFYQNTLQNAVEKETKRILEETSALDVAFVFGLPVYLRGKIFNAAAACHKGKILGVVPKTYLPNYSEFYEKRIFSPPLEGVCEVTLCGQKTCFGTDILFRNADFPAFVFSAEICEDLWTATPPSTLHAYAGATVLANLSASTEFIGKEEYRRDMVKMQSSKCSAAYLYASAGEGESTTDVVYAAHNIIAETGKVLSESLPFEKGVAVCEIDLENVRHERKKMFNYLDLNVRQHLVVEYGGKAPQVKKPVRRYPAYPFVPQNREELKKRAEMILNIQSHGLKKRMEHTNCAALLLGVSGGLDSSLALFVCLRALKLLHRPASDLIAVTMPCFGTTERTKRNGIALAQSGGATVKEIDISDAVTQHLKDIGHDLTPDVTLENAQARERTQVLMDLANKYNGLVVGTGDLSELALGWSTYNGDHMSMYAVNGSVPKTLIPALLRHEAKKYGDDAVDVVESVIGTPISPELLPTTEKENAQKTEDAIGPYVLHDYFLYMLVRRAFTPRKILYLAEQTFDGQFDRATIVKWLKVFLKRFFSQQYKRSCIPNGVKIGSVSLSPRGDWRMPSDADVEMWLKDLDE